MKEFFRDLIDGIIGGYHGVTNWVYELLYDLQFGHVIYLAVQILFTVFLVAHLVNVVMTMVSLRIYGSSHRQVVKRICKRTYWIALLLQFILWCVVPIDVLMMVEAFNSVVCVVIGALAVVGYLLAAISMIFARQGKRAYIATSQISLSNTMVLYALWLLIFNWLMFSNL